MKEMIPDRRTTAGPARPVPNSRSFYIENLGCAKNQVDAESIIASLERDGFVYRDSPDEADIIIVNTCGFIAPAKEESIQTTLSLRERFPGRTLILAGCLAQRYGGGIRELLPEVDGIIGNGAPSRFNEALSALEGSDSGVLMPEADPYIGERNLLLTFPGSAYLKIAEGCSNRCSYCAIPLIRGSVRSRTLDEVVSEFRRLVAGGTYEINLIAQDLSSFGIDRGSGELPELLSRLSEVEGDFWVRLLYIHPDRFPREIIPIMKNDPRILPYFDLPFQHASQRLLSKMNRRGNGGRYLELVNGIRSELPDAVVRSTFLVGFPGETSRDFDELLRFQEAARLEWLGVFTYSREEDTPAYHMRGQLADRLARSGAEKRKRTIEELQVPITEKRLDRFVGRKLGVLVEERVEGEGLCLARGYLNAPEVDGLVVVHAEDLKPGTVREVVVAKRNGIDLEAVLPKGEAGASS